MTSDVERDALADAERDQLAHEMARAMSKAYLEHHSELSFYGAALAGLDALMSSSWLAEHDKALLDGFEERIEYGHQTVHGWIVEPRGIKYATHARKVMWRAEWPTFIDHWSNQSQRIVTDKPAARAVQGGEAE